MPQNIAQDILHFLGLGPHFEYVKKEALRPKGCFIVQSHFFDPSVYGTPQSLPCLPLKTLDNVPFLYGEARIERSKERVVVYADFVASTYFFLSRYEEWLATEDKKDEYGRLRGKASILYLSGLIHKPLVDTYAHYLQDILIDYGFLSHRPKIVVKVNLTHGVDRLTYYETLRGLAGGVLRSLALPSYHFKEVGQALFNPKHDPAFQFPWMLKEDTKLTGANIIYFLKTTLSTHPLDQPLYRSSDYIRLLSLIKHHNEQNPNRPEIQLGLHLAVGADQEAKLIKREIETLSHDLKRPIKQTRWHFLHTTHLEHYALLPELGISDDYSLTFADVAGFRCGTVRPFFWINPMTCQRTNLKIHPTLIMDVTLSSKNYMNLKENQAYILACHLIDEVKMAGGDLTLLWHNVAFSPMSGATYNHRELYTQILQYIHETIDFTPKK